MKRGGAEPRSYLHVNQNDINMTIKLSKVKVNQVYNFSIVEGGGAGSGSQCWFDVMGLVKEINAEFIRVIPTSNIKAGNKRSLKVYNRTITQISE